MNFVKLSALALLASLPTSDPRHGAVYWGGPPTPGREGAGPRGPSTPRPIGPGPGGGAPAGPSTPSTGGARPTTGSGLDADYTSWGLWWHFNKEPYLTLKAHVHSGAESTSDGWFLGNRGAEGSTRPSEELIQKSVVPALLETLQSATNKDIVSGCLLALAKIGEPVGRADEPSLAPVLRSFLVRKNQENSEVAAIALGILASPESIEDLAALLLDSRAGRLLVDQGEVNYRTRAFAAYGLGLIGARNPGEVTSERIVVLLHQALEMDRTASADLKVACIHAMGLVPLAGVMRLAQIDTLLSLLANEELDPLVRAHCPAALARLFPGMPEGRQEAYRQRITAALLRLATSESAPAPLVQGSVQALGFLGTNDGEDPLDRRIRKVLREPFTDQQAQRFALLALARVGARPGLVQPDVGVREAATGLLDHLARAQSDLRAWAGLACGILARGLTDAGQSMPAIGSLQKAVRLALAEEGDPNVRAALAIACGIMGAQDAAPQLLDLLARERVDDARGHVAVALGLLGSKEALGAVRKIMEESRYRPELLRHAAIALALLEDESAVPKLVGLLAESRGLATQASIASALGFIGDQRSIPPLVSMLRRPDLTDRARAYAAVALGIVAEKELLPWNSKLSQDIDYRAAPATLTDPASGTGILDIL